MPSQEYYQIELTHWDRCRLLAAGHALRMESGFYQGVTHEEARLIVENIIGFCPDGEPAGPSIEDCFAWLGLAEVL